MKFNWDVLLYKIYGKREGVLKVLKQVEQIAGRMFVLLYLDFNLFWLFMLNTLNGDNKFQVKFVNFP
jgi:hypothetical protein